MERKQGGLRRCRRHQVHHTKYYNWYTLYTRGRGKREEGRGKKEEGRGKMEDGRGKREEEVLNDEFLLLVGRCDGQR